MFFFFKLGNCLFFLGKGSRTQWLTGLWVVGVTIHWSFAHSPGLEHPTGLGTLAPHAPAMTPWVLESLECATGGGRMKGETQWWRGMW